MRRIVAGILAGSGFGAVIALLLSPLISRLFPPEVFGEFSTVLAVAVAIAGVSTQRLEVVAHSRKNDGQSSALLKAALLSNIGITALAGAATLLLITLDTIPGVWAILPLLLSVVGIQLVANSSEALKKNYQEIAIYTGVQNGGTPAAQIVFGVMCPGVTGLALGFISIRFIWSGAILRIMRAKSSRIRKTYLQVWRQAITAGASALMNATAGQLLILLSAILYGPIAAGIAAMSIRLLISPLSTVGQAVATASLGEVGALIRRDQGGAAATIVKKTALSLLALGSPPLLLVLLLAPGIIPTLLGEEWVMAGNAVQALALGALAQFAVAPFSQVMNIAGQSRRLAVWDATRLILFALAIVVPAIMGGGMIAAIWSYSAAQLILYLVMFKMVLSSLQSIE